MTELPFHVQYQEGRARAGFFSIRGVTVFTPCFMPVGTQGAIKAMDHRELSRMGYRMMLANTYHLLVQPGLDVIRDMGGIRNFIGTSLLILTDSGGFQAFSLAPYVKFSDDGIRFRSHRDGSLHFLSPESVLEAQRFFGSDIRMLLDEVVPFGADARRYRTASERTHRWAVRSAEYLRSEAEKGGCVFAIGQGGFDAVLRTESMERIVELGFAGYAAGGLSVGEDRRLYGDMAYATARCMPPDKVRYMMGVGAIPDVLTAIDAGFDIFDCVWPTRNARNGSLLTSSGAKNIRNARYRRDASPIDAECKCRICRHYSAAYIHHLFRAREVFAMTAATMHNLAFMAGWFRDARKSIEQCRFADFRRHWLDLYPESRGKRAKSGGKER